MQPIEYCTCEFPGLINDGDGVGKGVDINCHYCRKEVKGARATFEKSPNYNKYVELDKGRFAIKDKTS